MRSRLERVAWVAALAAVQAAGVGVRADEAASAPADAPAATAAASGADAAGVSAQAVAASAPAGALSRTAVDEAVRTLRQHPDLAGEELTHHLQFKHRDEPKPEQPDLSFLRWIGRFFEWLSEAGRWVVWGVGALAVAWLLVRLRVWWRERGETVDEALPPAPTHVRELDIRPESLPADVGRAALALWQAGRAREALSLLYRGALSRLVHRHGVAVRASSTEGDCLRLATAALDTRASAYFGALVGAWQLAVYGGRLPADAQVQTLCAAFDQRLGAAA
jgi:hypothetical protein